MIGWQTPKNTIRLFCKSKQSSRNLVPYQPFWWFTTKEWQLNSKQTIEINRRQRMQYLIIIKHTTVQIKLHKTHIKYWNPYNDRFIWTFKGSTNQLLLHYNARRHRFKQQNRNVRKTLMKKVKMMITIRFRI